MFYYCTWPPLSSTLNSAGSHWKIASVTGLEGGRERGREGGVEGKAGVDVVKEKGEGGKANVGKEEGREAATAVVKEKGREAGVEVEEGREVESEGPAEVEVEVEVEVGSASKGSEVVVLVEVVEGRRGDALASERAGAASVTTVLPFT